MRVTKHGFVIPSNCPEEGLNNEAKIGNQKTIMISFLYNHSAQSASLNVLQHPLPTLIQAY